MTNTNKPIQIKYLGITVVGPSTEDWFQVLYDKVVGIEVGGEHLRISTFIILKHRESGNYYVFIQLGNENKTMRENTLKENLQISGLEMNVKHSSKSETFEEITTMLKNERYSVVFRPK